MKTKNIGINAILNMIRQSLSILFPLITYPYALKHLGAEGIGKVNYAQSITEYFVLIAMLGIANYGIREGAQKREDKKKFTQFVNEVYTINFIFTIISYILLFCIVFTVPKLYAYRYLILLQSISIAWTAFGMDWINTIFEDFLWITIRSIFIYIVSILLLFVTVKDSGDYYQYAMLTVITNGIICISNRVYCRKYIHVRIVKKINFKKHIIPLLLLFTNAVVVTINTSFDTTMLGWIKGDYYVGLYALPVKIYTVIKSLINAIYIVMLPRLALLLGEKKYSEYKEVNTQMWGSVSLILFTASIGLICISKPVIGIMGGKDMMPSVPAMQLLAATLIFSAFSGMIMNVMNISLRKEKENLLAMLLSASLNIILNLFFIPAYNHTGAAMTTLISETFVFVFSLVRFKSIRNYLDFKVVFKSIGHALLGSCLIILITIFVNYYVTNYILQIIFIVAGSLVAYILMLIIIKDPYMYSFVEKVKERYKNVSNN